MFARLTSLCNLICIQVEFLSGVTVFLLQLWHYHPEPDLVEATSPGKANTPCSASHVSSLPCPLNKQLCPNGGYVEGRGTLRSIDELPLSSVDSPRCEQGLARTTHCWCLCYVMYTFPLLSFTDLPPMAEQPAAVKCKHSPREASAHFSLYKHPQPWTNQSLPSPFHTAQWHINTHAPTQTKHTEHTLAPMHVTTQTHTQACTDRRGGELMHCYPQQEDCEHSRNKYPVLIIKFSSCASLLVGQVHFLVKNIHT